MTIESAIKILCDFRNNMSFNQFTREEEPVTEDNSLYHAICYAIGVLAIKQVIDENNPLTLEELSEMNGQAVYLDTVQCWVLVTQNEYGPLFTFADGSQVAAKDWYNSTGGAYLRLPESERYGNENQG